MSTFGKIGWGDESEDDENFLKLETGKSLCNDSSSKFKKSLYERNVKKEYVEEEKVKVHKHDNICNNKNDHFFKIRNTVFNFDKLKRACIICSPLKHANKINELSDSEITNFLEDIDQFCIEWNINTYSVSYNSYEKYHFNAKIKCQMKYIDIIKKRVDK